MQDIQTKEDLYFLLQKFYEKALVDEVIGFFFTEVAHLDMEKHLPLITNFWESVLLNGEDYKGNPITAHVPLHQHTPMTHEHFERWVLLFQQTVDELFEGEVAERAKQRGQSIATVMQIKLHQIR